MLKNLLLVGLGGAAGSMLRSLTALWIKNNHFPLATLLVNIIGSFIIGLVIAVSLRNPSFDTNWRLFLATGICGGFTTFSAFSAENLQLIQQGRMGLFALYAVGSVLLGLGAAWLGFNLMK
ncbi:MAG: fluoride efflux transporter CrcB [Lacibacter sp.]